MPSKITLTFTGIPVEDTFVELKVGYLINNLKETFKSVRVASYQSKIGVDILGVMNNYLVAFSTDYNTSGDFTVTKNAIASTISIEYPISGWFTLGAFNDTSGVINAVIEDTPDPTLINIDDVSFSEATDPCNDVQLDITTDVLAVKYRINGGADVVNAINPFNFDYIRGAYINLEVENAEGNTSSQNIQLPQSLVAANIDVGILNSPSGATLTITVNNSTGLDLTYSLDDITYQSSNVFSGILEGDYTIYVKDQLGCSAQKDFSVPSFEDGGVTQKTAYADLPSKSNSIRFAKYVDWGICGNYKNDENTLSCDLPYTQNSRQVFQLFQSCDIITTQIKSNYANIVATIIEEDGTEHLVPVDKKSNNVGLQDKRDAIKYNLGGLGLQTGVYFTAGNTYDYDTGLVNGSYTLNGGLPAWGYIGNFIFLDGAWFEIQNIIFDETKSAEVLVIDAVYTGVDVSVIVSSIYDLENYDIYEFNIDMGVYNEKKIQVNITETDSRFDDAIFLSEIIDIQTEQENTVEIIYYNDTNTDIFYATGIENKIRIPIEFFSGGLSDNTEADRTDTNTYLIDSEGYENDTIYFQLISKQIMRKVVQALSHKFVFLNEVQYVKEDSPELIPLLGTNLYRVNAKMTKADAVYTSRGTGQTFSVGEFEVPSLLEQTSDGYIKIKN